MADLTVSFELYNEETVRILKEEDPDLLPDYSVNSSKDLAYNKKQVTNAIISGIIKGESIPKIASNLQSTIKSLNQSSAVSTARTAAIAAQNTGSLSAMKRLAEMGVEVQKEWVATLDIRTRPSHRALDGQRRNLDEAFSNGLQYPGASGNPAERWNCRCTITSYLPKYDSEDEPTLTYPEWVKYKQSQWSEPQKVTAEEYNAAKKWNKILTGEETLKKVNKMYASGDYNNLGSNAGDKARAITNSKLDYDALPKVVKETEFYSTVGNNQILYRGYKDSGIGSSFVSAGEMIEQLKYGELWTGISGGIRYGSGIYFGGNKSIADKYGTAGTVTASINPAAKIIDYETINNDYQDTVGKLKWNEQEALAMTYTLNDVGKYAAVKNYDVIYVPNMDYYVILNRSVLIIKE